MSGPTEHRSVQKRILEYAQQIGWRFVPQKEAEERRGFNPQGVSPKDRASTASLYFMDVLHEKIKEFNPHFKGSVDDLIREVTALTPDIYGNREFLSYLRGDKTFPYSEEKRELNLKLIDYENPRNNIYEVTEEFTYTNGKYTNREDVVFLINGIPILVIECKNATKDEAIAIGIDQIRRYHRETPELFVPQQIFTATESLGFGYGVTWNLIRRNIFNWKDEETGNLEAKIKSFCAKKKLLDLIGKFIVFAEQDEELHKYILRQHQQEAVSLIVERAHDHQKTRGLIWHTQGSGKTYTMIKAAELLFKAPQSNKPTIILMIDRTDLEDQMIKNLDSVGIGNVMYIDSISHLNEQLRKDYRGIIVTTIQKFKDTQKDINKRENIYVLIDEAHRTTQGDLGNYLMAALPNASYIGFTGTPIDKTQYGKGTFKIFGIHDEKGYLHKYSIADSIKDGTTLPLFYSIAPNELLVPKEILEEEFLTLSEGQGITDIEELNKILKRAVNTRNFLKGKDRIDKVAQYVAYHYRANVEPLGYKAFLVAVDREACALYKEALDKYLPSDYSEVVYTEAQNDTEKLKKYYHDEPTERKIRKQFAKYGERPKILIVTEKLLTGYDAPILYAMYLDKPMRDHTLLQAIARVNRPYENEEQKMVKPHGFVLDFIGIFDKLEKALAFDSNEVNAVIKDIDLLKTVFKTKMEQEVPKYITIVSKEFTDKDTDTLIEHFRDEERRKKLFKLYKEVEMLYEIISPDAFLRPFINDYSTLSAIYIIVRNAFTKRTYVDREFQRKTNELVQKHVGLTKLKQQTDFFELNENTLSKIRDNNDDNNVKVINLIKSIERTAEKDNEDLFLLSMLERAEEVKTRYEKRQATTKETLEALRKLFQDDVTRRLNQKEKGFDNITHFIYNTLSERGIPHIEETTIKIQEAFEKNPNWHTSANELRELRAEIYFALLSQEDSIEKVTKIIDEIFRMLSKAYNI